MSPVHIGIKRIEFSVTHACGGRCRHCSVAAPEGAGGSVDAYTAVGVIRQLADKYAVESIMTFGGEPLLYADTVCEIHGAARDCGIHARQIITNGFFTRDESKIANTAADLCNSGVNDVLMSADAFHQEHIPIEPVLRFAEALMKNGIPRLRVHPAWLVDEDHDNPYNEETRRLMGIFRDRGIEPSRGNNIFPAGNALKYLKDYFPRPEAVDLSLPCGSMPYTGRLDEIDCVSVNPNGDVNLCSFSIGNIYDNDILTILDNYNPCGNPATRALMEGGAERLLEYAEGLGVTVDVGGCYSACGACEAAIAALRERGLA